GSPLDASRPLRMSAAGQRVVFSFAGLSLAAPERVRFKYRLDSFDSDWSQPVSATDAVYTNLRPGTYEFHVIASNSDGAWNGRPATVTLAVDPLFWQTWWFRVAAIACVGALALGLYRVRMRQLAWRLNLRFEERLAERTRIAQELHDTL